MIDHQQCANGTHSVYSMPLHPAINSARLRSQVQSYNNALSSEQNSHKILQEDFLREEMSGWVQENASPCKPRFVSNRGAINQQLKRWQKRLVIVCINLYQEGNLTDLSLAEISSLNASCPTDRSRVPLVHKLTECFEASHSSPDGGAWEHAAGVTNDQLIWNEEQKILGQEMMGRKWVLWSDMWSPNKAQLLNFTHDSKMQSIPWCYHTLHASEQYTLHTYMQ